MRLIIQPDYQSVSQWAAHYVAAKIKAANPTPEKPFVLGCPTGSSPLGMYKALIDLNKKGIVSFQNVVTFNMDEYVGPVSYTHLDVYKRQGVFSAKACGIRYMKKRLMVMVEYGVVHLPHSIIICWLITVIGLRVFVEVVIRIGQMWKRWTYVIM